MYEIEKEAHLAGAHSQSWFLRNTLKEINICCVRIKSLMLFMCPRNPSEKLIVMNRYSFNIRLTKYMQLKTFSFIHYRRIIGYLICEYFLASYTYISYTNLNYCCCLGKVLNGYPFVRTKLNQSHLLEEGVKIQLQLMLLYSLTKN